MGLMRELQEQYDYRMPVVIEKPMVEQAEELTILAGQLSHYADTEKFAEILAEIHQVSSTIWEPESC